MWQPTKRQWWSLLVIAVVLVAAWPPANDRSLLMTFVNWAADPSNSLPTLPGPSPVLTSGCLSGMSISLLSTAGFEN